MHVAAWLIWAAAVMGVASTTRNPLYLTLLFLVVLVVVERANSAEAGLSLRVHPLRFALWALPASALINGFLTHYGETVLFRLPDAIPLLGGPVTAEALLYGTLNGLILSILLATFSGFTTAVPARDLLRLVPRAFFPVALVTSVAVTFLPATLRQAQQIREAQAIRGHRMRRLRDWLPLFMPLLVGGMERSLQLAEAMTARGFAGGGAARRERWEQVGSILSVGLIAAGVVVWIGWAAPVWGIGLIAVGSWLLVRRFWHSERQVRRTAYRHVRWDGWDTAVVLCSALGVLVYWVLGANSRVYAVYPVVTWPRFEPLAGAALLGLLAPSLVRRGEEVG